jgi:hypothetical protein
MAQGAAAVLECCTTEKSAPPREPLRLPPNFRDVTAERVGTVMAEVTAEIGPGLAAPASPIRFSGERAKPSPARHEAHQRGCQRALLAVPIAGGRIRAIRPPAKPQRPPSGPESCLGGDAVTAMASIVDLP